MLSLLVSLTTLQRQTRAPSHILSYRRKHSCWLLLHEFEGEPVSSSEWVKAYGQGGGVGTVSVQNNCTDFSKDTKHIPSSV